MPNDIHRGVAREGAGGPEPPPPEFGRSVNPVQTRGADYAPHTTASPPGFKKLSTPLIQDRITRHSVSSGLSLAVS